MRKNTLFMKTKTLEIKNCLLHLSFSFYTLFHCDPALMVEGRTYPCIRIVILPNSRKYYMSVPVPVSAVPVLVLICYWCFSVWGYRYRLELYRYRLATIEFQLGCTGTGTTASALVSQHRCTSQNFTTVVAIILNDPYSLSGHEPL